MKRSSQWDECVRWGGENGLEELAEVVGVEGVGVDITSGHRVQALLEHEAIVERESDDWLRNGYGRVCRSCHRGRLGLVSRHRNRLRLRSDLDQGRIEDGLEPGSHDRDDIVHSEAGLEVRSAGDTRVGFAAGSLSGRRGGCLGAGCVAVGDVVVDALLMPGESSGVASGVLAALVGAEEILDVHAGRGDVSSCELQEMIEDLLSLHVRVHVALLEAAHVATFKWAGEGAVQTRQNAF